MAETVTTVYFVRHGEAVSNVKGLYAGVTDVELTQNGKDQLSFLEERFKDIALDAVYTSPLQRARQTAEALNRYPRAPLVEEAGLKEWNGGLWENARWDELPTLYPKEWDLWEHALHLLRIPGGESLDEFADRCLHTVERLVRENEGKTIAVSSHGGVLRVLLWLYKGNPRDSLSASFWHDNTSVSCVRFDGKGHSSVVLENDISHLAEGMNTFAKFQWFLTEKEKKGYKHHE
ncbi:MAG: histidine phosphatase family protein [Clostridia bacterium]|nr:histidine phosphatase family protein [Clostridia bacterium]